MLVDTVTAWDVATGALVPMQDRQPPPGQLPEWGNAAPVGLAIVLVLLLATAFLIRNMSKRITRLPESFEPDGAGQTGAGSDSAGADGAGQRSAGRDGVARDGGDQDDVARADVGQDTAGPVVADEAGRAGPGDGQESRSS